jgi:hypothetical protein
MKNAIPAAIAIILITALPAHASDDEKDCPYQSSGQPMEQQQIRARLVEQGYEVRKIEVEDGCYEAYAIDKDGRRVELFINPVSGEARQMKSDD